MNLSDVKTNIIRSCHRMDLKGWVANHDGNISVRKDRSRYWCTPTSRAKADLEVRDLLEVDLEGKVLEGRGKPFSEWSIHSRVYSARSDAAALIHAHPPYAMAVGCANQEMLTTAVPEAVVSLGPGVPLVGLSLPGSVEMWRELDPLLPHYDAVLVAGNGVFAWGSSLEQAYLRLELIEHLAQIFLVSLPLGGPRMLNEEQVAQLLKKRESAGLARPPDPARPKWFPLR